MVQAVVAARTLLLLASSTEARSRVLARVVRSVRRRGGALLGVVDYSVAPLADLYEEGGRLIARYGPGI